MSMMPCAQAKWRESNVIFNPNLPGAVMHKRGAQRRESLKRCAALNNCSLLLGLIGEGHVAAATRPSFRALLGQCGARSVAEPIRYVLSQAVLQSLCEDSHLKQRLCNNNRPQWWYNVPHDMLRSCTETTTVVARACIRLPQPRLGSQWLS